MSNYAYKWLGGPHGRHWARDHFLPALRAEGYVIALAAADQEPTNSDAAPEGAAPPATRYVGDQHTADQEPTDG